MNLKKLFDQHPDGVLLDLASAPCSDGVDASLEEAGSHRTSDEATAWDNWKPVRDLGG